MSFSLSLLVLSLLSLQWSSVAGQTSVASVSYTTASMPAAFRGMSCAAARYYPYNTGSYNIIALEGNTTSNFYTSPAYQNDGMGGWPEYTPVPQGVEGNYFHYVWSYQAESIKLLVGGGRTNDTSGNVVPAAWYFINDQWLQVNVTNNSLPPLTKLSWNWTSTSVMDRAIHDDPSYVTVIYGGWVVNPGGEGTFDNTFYVIETNPDWANETEKVTLGKPSPFSTARMGVAMASFNDSKDGPARGRFAVIGGMEWPTNIFTNDVWVAQSPRDDSTAWTNFGAAPFSPRYSAQAFEGGRQGIFIYGGVDSDGVYQNDDVWYGQFYRDPSDASNPPVWSVVPVSGGYGPTSVPGCSVALWYDSNTLLLISIASHTNTPYDKYVNPTDVWYVGTVQYN